MPSRQRPTHTATTPTELTKRSVRVVPELLVTGEMILLWLV